MTGQGVSVVPAIVLQHVNQGEMIDLPTCSTHNPCQGRKKITRPSLVAGSSRPMLTEKINMQSLLITQNSKSSIEDESHVPGE